jgi:hypothetical protein
VGGEANGQSRASERGAGPLRTVEYDGLAGVRVLIVRAGRVRTRRRALLLLSLLRRRQLLLLLLLLLLLSRRLLLMHLMLRSRRRLLVALGAVVADDGA